eukprot:jgi/Botrbrau1/770/Bobra.0181s0024.2
MELCIMLRRVSLTTGVPDNFCIIESRESIKDFANLGLGEITDQIQSRRNKIYFLMEEVRRLRIQQRMKGGQMSKEEELGEERYPSVVPFFPPLTDETIKDYANFYFTAVSAIILFGGIIAPILEVRLGIGGTSYSDFIRGLHLPAQLAEVDPIVASFCGGAVGVLTTLLVLEANNSKVVAKNRCIYCGGTGYVTCGACGGKTVGPIPLTVDANGAKQPLATEDRCATCSGTGKVACIACFCTGKKVARESDPRLDPFS